MKRIGLTGGFATGKSTVGKFFEELGLPRVDADEITHQLLATNPKVQTEIIQLFGKTILNAKGAIDRKMLGKIIFQDATLRRKLETILHPLVETILEKKIKELEDHGHSIVLLEIPLLFEASWHRQRKLDVVIVVAATRETQIRRAQTKTKLTRDEIEARLQAQLPLVEKKKQADYVIDNDGDLAQTKAQVEKTFQKLTDKK